MAQQRKATTDGLEILDRLFYEGRPRRQVELERTRIEDEMARKILRLRQQAGLSQAQLARRMGVSVRFLTDLEEAAVETNYVLWLQRAAAAVSRRLEIRCVPLRRQLQPA